jgi:large subunit ribosomal protein L15
MTFSLHTLKNEPGARHRRIRVGRGESSGKGKTSGKGNKGQMARSGHKRKPMFEGGQMRMIRRIPKRGFNSPNKTVYAPVNVGDLKKFEAGSSVTIETLHASGLVKGVHSRIKILGNGEMDRKLTIKAHAFSASAKSKIEAAGGSCEVLK